MKRFRTWSESSSRSRPSSAARKTARSTATLIVLAAWNHRSPRRENLEPLWKSCTATAIARALLPALNLSTSSLNVLERSTRNIEVLFTYPARSRKFPDAKSGNLDTSERCKMVSPDFSQASRNQSLECQKSKCSPGRNGWSPAHRRFRYLTGIFEPEGSRSFCAGQTNRPGTRPLGIYGRARSARARASHLRHLQGASGIQRRPWRHTEARHQRPQFAGTTRSRNPTAAPFARRITSLFKSEQRTSPGNRKARRQFGSGSLVRARRDHRANTPAKISFRARRTVSPRAQPHLRLALRRFLCTIGVVQALSVTKHVIPSEVEESRCITSR